MFLLKSTFWLGMAFIVIKPVGFDMNSANEAVSQAALNASSKIIINQITSTPCNDLQCSGGKALTLASTILSNVELTSRSTKTTKKALQIPTEKTFEQLTAPNPKPPPNRKT